MCINFALEKENWDATNSWSGYNYQGKIALFVVLQKINDLISKNKIDEIEKYCVELEWLEDFSILYKSDEGVQYRTIHQVKAKDKQNISDYEDALSKLYYKVAKWRTIVRRHFKWSGDCTVAANKNLPIKAVTHTACGKKRHAFFLHRTGKAV